MLRLGYLVLTLTTILSLGLFVYPTSPHTMTLAPRQVAPLTQAIDNFTLTGCAASGLGTCTAAGWNGTTSKPNPAITVHQYDQVRIKLTSSDTMMHQFWLDVDKDTFTDTSDCPANDICSAVFPPSPITKIIMNLTAMPGTYQYFCTIHPDVMLATFTILAQPTVGGTTVMQTQPGPSPILELALISLLTIAIASFYQQTRKKQKSPATIF